MSRKGCCVELLLMLVGLELHFSASCPKNCVCYPSPMTVSCQAHNFTSIPEGIPTNSERVFLQNNKISMLLRGHFSPSMVTLWIYSNNITFIDPETFDGFVQLEELDLGDNRYLSSLGSETFHGLVKLHALHLYRCGLSSLPRRIFSGLFNLQYLYLQENQVEFLPDDLFIDMVNLSHLFLHGNKLRTLHENTFRGLVNLDRLLLHQNQLQMVHKWAFHDLKRLTTLFLFNNSLSELPGECLAQLGSLEFLRLNGNPWGCDCRARSLWDWLRRFRGSSSSVICETPKEMRGRDLKVISKEHFHNCSGSESLHQTKTNTHATLDKTNQKDHHIHPSAKEKGKEQDHQLHSSEPALPTRPRPGHKQHGRNCTRHKHRSSKTAAPGSKKSSNSVHTLDGMLDKDYMTDFGHKFSRDMVPTGSPRRKGKCTKKTPIRTPSGVQASNRGSLSIRASLVTFIVALFTIIR
ncbi:reticulon-4 receptor-like 1 [Latimeria chalumnae]|uniref:reticulon-4 receptor-like 1 n=1 Tax=Latimeria chalumnae TaxID=7897 RepID=UPI0006D93857|nr:PREDICTED: reticulon-4 receptor-like 1 [Latimeria chalumnae]|eukprot:XP_014353085.1 PREDICTED: reticulon-4 receptor-like 1 [Latimeria chalumnae]